MRLIDWTNILLFHCFAFTIGTTFVNSWSSSLAFKVLKDTGDGSDYLQIFWSLVLLMQGFSVFFLTDVNIFGTQIKLYLLQFSQGLPRFLFYKKNDVPFLLIARLIVEHDDLMHARYDRWQIKIRISRNPTNWATNTASIVIACMSKCKASWHPHIYCY